MDVTSLNPAIINSATFTLFWEACDKSCAEEDGIDDLFENIEKITYDTMNEILFHFDHGKEISDEERKEFCSLFNKDAVKPCGPDDDFEEEDENGFNRNGVKRSLIQALFNSVPCKTVIIVGVKSLIRMKEPSCRDILETVLAITDQFHGNVCHGKETWGKERVLQLRVTSFNLMFSNIE